MSCLSCLYSNVSSLKNKIDEFESIIAEREPDVIGLTEVWMKEAYSIKGYHPVFRHDRDVDQKGGGVMLFVHENLTVTECIELNEMDFQESVWCVIHMTHTEKLLVGVCYRSPSSSKENNEKLNLMLHCTQRIQAQNVLIMGDFNFPHWDYLKEKLLAAIMFFVPEAKKRTRRGVQIPWWNKGLKQEV